MSEQLTEDVEHLNDPHDEPMMPPRGHTLGAETIMKPIRDFMRTRVGTIAPSETISASVQQMVGGHYGCVLVVEDECLVGILSERDILCRVVHPGLDPSKVTVGEHMTRRPETLQPEDALAYALNIMAIGGFRHVPIVDEKRHVAGIISIRDIQKLLVSYFQEEILTLPPLPIRSAPADRYGG